MFVKHEHEEVVKRGQYLLVLQMIDWQLFCLNLPLFSFLDWLDPFRQVL